MKGKYIYGIIDGNIKVNFSSKGLFNKKPYTINYNSISAIITEAPVKTYEADQKGLLSHNRILDEVIKNNTVLPMRFGTIARSEDEIRSLLQNAYAVLKSRLQKIKDKVEFDVSVSINDEQIILKEILEKKKEIRDLRDKLIAQGKDVQIKDKLLIGKMIAVEVMMYKDVLLKDIVKTLKIYSVQQKSLAGRNLLSNMAFLVSKTKIKDFESTIYKLGEKYGDRLKFKYAGPLAPYSFVEIKLVLMNFNTVDKARQQLGLENRATFSEIKEAYRKLAQNFHPDKNPGDSYKEEEFKKIADSYKLLYAYCRHYPKKRYVFKPEQIDEFSFLVESE